MGVLPLEFLPGQTAQTLALTGHETYAVHGLSGLATGEVPQTLDVTADGITFQVRPRLDTTRELDFYRHGGSMRFVLRQMLETTAPRRRVDSDVRPICRDTLLLLLEAVRSDVAWQVRDAVC